MSVIKIFITPIFLLSIVSPVYLANAASISNEVFIELEKQIQLDGSTSVIVEYADSANLNGSQSSISSTKKLNRIKSMRQQFMSSMSVRAAQSIKHDYQYVPASVLNVDQETLSELRNNSNIRNIYQNKQRKAHLAESIGIVNGKQGPLRFNGGGEWVVAVLDTGVDKNHSFLKPGTTQKVISEACYTGGGYSSNFQEIDRLCPADSSSTTATGSGVPCTGYSDSCDHGTHVAGIAAGDGSSFDGVASGGRILAVQVFTGLRDVFNRNVCGTGFGNNCVVAFDSDILRGLERVYALRNSLKIAAVNMSLGGGKFSSGCSNENSLITNIINQLKTAGIATVVSSGNSGYSSSIGFPACIPNAIAVGATSDFTGTVSGNSVTKDQRVFFSNVGSSLDLYAPGIFIQSSIPGGGFANFGGTSMSAPHVAGAFAVLKHGKPSATVAELESILKSVGPNIAASGVTRRRLDVASALAELGLGPVDITPILLLLDEDI